MYLESHEVLIEGHWELKQGELVADLNCTRIEQLIREHLSLLKEGEWMNLYEDPRDRRKWLLFYQQSEMHGGGPPSLRVVSKEEILELFD